MGPGVCERIPFPLYQPQVFLPVYRIRRFIKNI